MNFFFKTLATAACSLAIAGTASAHNTRHHHGHKHHHKAPVVRVQAYYAPAPVYVPYREVVVRPAWQDRREWRRERAMRRAEWERRQEWRRHQWRMEQRRRHHHHHGYDGYRY